MVFRHRLLLILLLAIFHVKTYSQSFSNGDELFLKNWFICSSEKVLDNGAIISSSEFSAKDWYPSFVPSTVLGSLVTDSVYKDVFVGENLKNIPSKQFEKPWWYRTEFFLSTKEHIKFVRLIFEGINYRANIWLNGKFIADSSVVAGAVRMFDFDVTKFIERRKENVLAVEIFPPRKGDPTIGFVDWNPEPPDNSMGIWRPVKLKFSGDVSINYPFIQSKINLETLKSADLTVSAELQNNVGGKVCGILSGKIGDINFAQKIRLEPNERRLVTFTPQDFGQLKIKNPKLWWTYNLGKPSLYHLKLSFNIKGKVSDKSETQFGIREVSDYINEEGYRGYKLNGRKILILGGGWVDNLFLNNSYENIKTQIDYVKQMGLNGIRLEGIWGESSDLFNLCDEKGILMMVGWSCQWEWKEYIGKPADDYGAIKSPKEISLISKSFKDQIKWLRNHPSIFVWLYGSDKIPRPELERKYLTILKNDDPTRPFLSSSENGVSSLTGKVGMKHGPYDYVPPVYWWIYKNKGGAFGFNSEVSPGAEVPPIESIRKMIPKNDLWPIDSVWNFHCAENTFGNLNDYSGAMDNRLGTPQTLDDYCTKAQYLNYENTRAMFEAYIANKYNATGVIHWMLNGAWPKLWWQLYDYYLLPGGAFYGAKKACEPIHILYSYGDGAVIVVNGTLHHQNKLTAKIRVLNFDLTEKYSRNISLNLSPDESHKVLQLPTIVGLSKTYFIDLKLFNGKEIVSSNFYCLSTKPDILDRAKTDRLIPPIKEYADLAELNKLRNVHLTIKERFTSRNDKDFVEAVISNNTDRLAFQIVLSIINGKDGEAVLPIFWEDNYFPLLPGERRKIKGFFYKKDLAGKKPVLKVSGWNVN
jgi:exo-1,4-beta-D-glucosaminidase